MPPLLFNYSSTVGASGSACRAAPQPVELHVILRQVLQADRARKVVVGRVLQRVAGGRGGGSGDDGGHPCVENESREVTELKSQI